MSIDHRIKRIELAGSLGTWEKFMTREEAVARMLEQHGDEIKKEAVKAIRGEIKDAYLAEICEVKIMEIQQP